MTSSKRLVSVPPGRELVEALNEACAGVDGWVQAVGTVDTLELRVAGEGVHPRRALTGRWTLASLAGATGGPYAVTLARATKSGIEVFAGELLSGRSEGVTAVVDVIGAAASLAEPEPEPRPAPAPAPEPKVASSWASAALETAAATREADEPDDEPEMPGPGDLVRHFAFGLCEVLMGDDERLKIRDLHGPGRIRGIRLDVLAVGVPTEQDGKRVFRLDRRH